VLTLACPRASAIQSFNVSEFSVGVYASISLNFIYLLLASTALGVAVSLSPFHIFFQLSLLGEFAFARCVKNCPQDRVSKEHNSH
jgi:hypothetical protein